MVGIGDFIPTKHRDNGNSNVPAKIENEEENMPVVISTRTKQRAAQFAQAQATYIEMQNEIEQLRSENELLRVDLEVERADNRRLKDDRTELTRQRDEALLIRREEEEKAKEELIRIRTQFKLLGTAVADCIRAIMPS